MYEVLSKTDNRGIIAINLFITLSTSAPAPQRCRVYRDSNYLTRALEQAHRLGEKPVTAEIVEAVMAPDINALEPMLIRHGYTARDLTELLNVRPAEVRALLHGQLPEERVDELKQQLLRTGIPL